MENTNAHVDTGEARPAVRSTDWLGRNGERRNKPPELQVAQNKEGTHYGLGGWHELDMWGLRNSPIWKAISDRCKYAGISETDRLKMLCAALLEDSEQKTHMVLQYAAEYGMPLRPNR